MEKESTGRFDSLFDLAGKFIESQRGVLNHTMWTDFLEGLLEKGYELTDDVKTYTDSVLEATKKFFNAMSATTGVTRVVTDVLGHTVSFMMDTTRVWDQREWGSFLKELKEQGIDFTDEMMNYFERVLEVSQEIYSSPVKGANQRTVSTDAP